MVLLTMTPALVAAVENCQVLQLDSEALHSENEPSLVKPTVGNPISHGQIIDLSHSLLKHYRGQDMHTATSYHLADLLHGSEVYVPPPKPKPAQSSEYKELMARLRKEEEARAYARMVNTTSAPTNPLSKYTAPKTARAWDLYTGNSSAADKANDTNFDEINQQLALVINVLVSILACGIGVWMIARHWSVPIRLALSMLSSLVVGVAEVTIYAVYVSKLGAAKSKEKSKLEKKTITDTWVIQAGKKEDPQRVGNNSKTAGTALASNSSNEGARRRTGR